MTRPGMEWKRFRRRPYGAADLYIEGWLMTNMRLRLGGPLEYKLIESGPGQDTILIKFRRVK